MRREKIGRLLAKVGRPGKLPASQYLPEGDFPVIDQGASVIAGYHNDPELVFRGPLPITIFGDHTRAVKLSREPFICGADGTQLLYPNDESVDPVYFYYAIQNVDLSNYFYARHLKFLRDHEISIPSLDVQRRIVDFIEPIDDLIENNRRRIALLEQFARLLYREWFVHLRFPGHEHVKVVDGVPEGWERKPLKEIATLNYGKALKEELRQPGPYPVYGSSGIVGSHVAGLTSGPGIIVGRKGNVGSVYWSPVAFFAIDTVYYISVEQSSLYLYHALQDAQFISTDVAVPGLNRDFAYSRQLLVPADQVLSEFLETVTPFHQQIEKLTMLSEKLREARDLLLSRLMSGELAV